MVASTQTGRSLLLALVLFSASCGELSLQRRAESVPADTISREGTSPQATPAGNKARRMDTREESAGFAEIRRALRRLVGVEQTFFAENGTYTENVSLTGLGQDKNVTIRFLWLSRDGWAASGTHAAVPGKDCVIFVGRAEAPPTTLKLVKSGREGVPVCDERTPAPEPTAAAPARAAPSRPDTANALDLLDPRVVMKVDLRNLAHSQETYFAMQGFYARRTEALALQYLWHRDVRIQILAGDAESWAAQATHARLPGRSCVIWFGSMPRRPVTQAGKVEAHTPGVPVCDN